MSGRQQAVPAWFGRRLRAAREHHGWSMRDLAGMCGVNASTILRAEHGGDISLALALAMARAVGVPIGRLTAETGCVTCEGLPPAGFICGECGRSGVVDDSTDSINGRGEEPVSELASRGTGRCYPPIDGRCTHFRCHEPNAYRMVGHCGNCGSGPYLILLTAGHDRTSDEKCPKCGCRKVRCERLAEDDELPAGDVADSSDERTAER